MSWVEFVSQDLLLSSGPSTESVDGQMSLLQMWALTATCARESMLVWLCLVPLGQRITVWYLDVGCA